MRRPVAKWYQAPLMSIIVHIKYLVLFNFLSCSTLSFLTLLIFNLIVFHFLLPPLFNFYSLSLLVFLPLGSRPTHFELSPYFPFYFSSSFLPLFSFNSAVSLLFRSVRPWHFFSLPSFTFSSLLLFLLLPIRCLMVVEEKFGQLERRTKSFRRHRLGIMSSIEMYLLPSLSIFSGLETGEKGRKEGAGEVRD